MPKKKAVETNVTDIEIKKDLGFTLVTDSKYAKVDDFIPTFIPQIDRICGGGIPLQRVTEVYSPEGVGKSTFMIELTKACSKLGVKTFYIDGEGTADPKRFAELGVDPSNTYVAAPDDDKDVMTIEYAGELLLKIIDKFRQTQEPIVVIVDSIGGIPTQAEMDTKLDEEGQRGRKAAAVTKLVTKLNALIKKTNVSVIFINQVRDNQNMKSPYDVKTIRPGGRALGFADSLRLELKKGSQIKDTDKNYLGHVLHVKTDKSKVSRPKQQVDTSIFARPVFSTSKFTYQDFPNIEVPANLTSNDKILYYVDGIDYEHNLYQEGETLGLISKSGGYRSYVDKVTGEEIKQYEADFIFLLKENVNDLRTHLFQDVLFTEFPYNFPPLDNLTVSVDSWPDMQGVREHYTNVNKNKVKKDSKSGDKNAG